MNPLLFQPAFCFSDKDSRQGTKIYYRWIDFNYDTIATTTKLTIKIQLIDFLLYILVRRIQANTPHDSAQFLSMYSPIVITIKKQKSLDIFCNKNKFVLLTQNINPFDFYYVFLKQCFTIVWLHLDELGKSHPARLTYFKYCQSVLKCTINIQEN